MPNSYTLTTDQTLSQLSQEFSEFVARPLGLSIPENFLVLSVNTMQHLKTCGRTNVLYALAKGIGTVRDDNSNSLFPSKRLPMGLLQHMANFFVARGLTNVRNVTLFNVAMLNVGIYLILVTGIRSHQGTTLSY